MVTINKRMPIPRNSTAPKKRFLSNLSRMISSSSGACTPFSPAVSAGIVAPEAFMDVKKWKEFEGNTSLLHIKRVDVKLVDYQKVPADERSWLDSSLKNLEPSLLVR